MANQQWARLLPQPQPTVLRLAQVPEAGMMRPQWPGEARHSSSASSGWMRPVLAAEIS